MPIYEYQCDNCGATLEKLQKLNDAPLTHCPECGEHTLRKLISAPGFRLKGGGWYETDFKKDKQKNLHDSAHGESKSAPQDEPGGKTGGKSAESKSGDGQKSGNKSSDAGKKDSAKKSSGSGKTSPSAD